jgi:hypothetical protein
VILEKGQDIVNPFIEFNPPKYCSHRFKPNGTQGLPTIQDQEKTPKKKGRKRSKKRSKKKAQKKGGAEAEVLEAALVASTAVVNNFSKVGSEVRNHHLENTGAEDPKKKKDVIETAAKAATLQAVEVIAQAAAKAKTAAEKEGLAPVVSALTRQKVREELYKLFTSTKGEEKVLEVMKLVAKDKGKMNDPFESGLDQFSLLCEVTKFFTRIEKVWGGNEKTKRIGFDPVYKVIIKQQEIKEHRISIQTLIDKYFEAETYTEKGFIGYENRIEAFKKANPKKTKEAINTILTKIDELKEQDKEEQQKQLNFPERVTTETIENFPEVLLVEIRRLKPDDIIWKIKLDDYETITIKNQEYHINSVVITKHPEEQHYKAAVKTGGGDEEWVTLNDNTIENKGTKPEPHINGLLYTKTKPISYDKPKGLVNRIFDCYLISAIQAVKHCKPFRDSIIRYYFIFEAINRIKKEIADKKKDLGKLKLDKDFAESLLKGVCHEVNIYEVDDKLNFLIHQNGNTHYFHNDTNEKDKMAKKYTLVNKEDKVIENNIERLRLAYCCQLGVDSEEFVPKETFEKLLKYQQTSQNKTIVERMFLPLTLTEAVKLGTRKQLILSKPMNYKKSIRPGGFIKQGVLNAAFRTLNVSKQNQDQKYWVMTTTASQVFLNVVGYHNNNVVEENMNQINRSKLETVYIPVNVNDNHWILYIAKIEEEEITYQQLDSTGRNKKTYPHYFVTLTEWL